MRKAMWACVSGSVLFYLAGCSDNSESRSDTDSLASVKSELTLSGTPWPDKLALVCWDDTTRARSDFGLYSTIMQGAANRMWTQATGLEFFDWGICPSNPVGMIVGRMQSSGQSHCGPISYDPNRPNDLLVGIGNSPILHEMGHCLGFAHEFARADWSAPCHSRGGSFAQTLGTPTNDVDSIMAGMGYCKSPQRISYWDVVGSQKVYGFPNMFADVTGDHKDDAIVIRSNGVFARPANSTSTSFSTESVWASGEAFYGDKGTFLGDVTGDGRSDLVMIDDGGVFVRQARSDAARLVFGLPGFGPLSRYTEEPYWGTLETHLADVTGDCLADVVAINDTETYVRDARPVDPLTGNGNFGTGWPIGPSRMGIWEHTVFANVSHPGAAKGCWADAIYMDSDGVWVATSNGTVLSEPTIWASVGGLGYAMRAVLVGDVTGDGLADIVEVNDAGVYVMRSTGSSFGDPETWNSTGIGKLADRGVFLADVNGDNAADLVLVGPDRLRVAKSNGTKFTSYSFWTASPYWGEQLMH